MVANPVVDQVISAGLGESEIFVFTISVYFLANGSFFIINKHFSFPQTSTRVSIKQLDCDS